MNEILAVKLQHYTCLNLTISQLYHDDMETWLRAPIMVTRVRKFNAVALIRLNLKVILINNVEQLHSSTHSDYVIGKLGLKCEVAPSLSRKKINKLTNARKHIVRILRTH